MGIERERVHLSPRHDETSPGTDACRVFAFTRRPVAVADQFDQGLKSHEGAAAPIFGEVAEEPVLDLVPFAPRGSFAKFVAM
jgi:hypothetical protein